MQEEIFEIEAIRPKSPAERWAEALAAAASVTPVHPQIARVQGVAGVLKTESTAVMRNLEVTRKEHQGELEREQKIFEEKAWRRALENHSIANKSLEILS